jgi:hypothetical protein
MPTETFIAVHPNPDDLDADDPEEGDCDINADEATCRRLCTPSLKMTGACRCQRSHD